MIRQFAKFSFLPKFVVIWYMYTAEPEITVDHWPFSDHIQNLAEQIQTNSLHIFSGEANNS